MSRTRRKPSFELPNHKQEYSQLVDGIWYYARRPVKYVPSKREVAMHTIDGRWESRRGKKWYMNQVSRVRRADNRAKLVHVIREDIDFDDSVHERKRRGIMWEIY